RARMDRGVSMLEVQSLHQNHRFDKGPTTHQVEMPYPYRRALYSESESPQHHACLPTNAARFDVSNGFYFVTPRPIPPSISNPDRLALKTPNLCHVYDKFAHSYHQPDRHKCADAQPVYRTNRKRKCCHPAQV